jgi:5'-nucleotidase
VLLDAGDVFQGTPYFNFYSAEPDFKAMSLMGYDAMAIGNHEFDNGTNTVAGLLRSATSGGQHPYAPKAGRRR